MLGIRFGVKSWITVKICHSLQLLIRNSFLDFFFNLLIPNSFFELRTGLRFNECFFVRHCGNTNFCDCNSLSVFLFVSPVCSEEDGVLVMNTNGK